MEYLIENKVLKELQSKTSHFRASTGYKTGGYVGFKIISGKRFRVFSE